MTWNQYIDSVLIVMINMYESEVSLFNLCHVVFERQSIHGRQLYKLIDELPDFDLHFKFDYPHDLVGNKNDTKHRERYLQPRILFLKSLKEAV